MAGGLYRPVPERVDQRCCQHQVGHQRYLGIHRAAPDEIPVGAAQLVVGPRHVDHEVNQTIINDVHAAPPFAGQLGQEPRT